jgi:hypothetical protein
VLLQLVPVALFAALWTRRPPPRAPRRRPAPGAFPRGRARRAPALAALDAAPAADGRFYDALFTAVTAYLGAKLDLPPGAIERERVLAAPAGQWYGAADPRAGSPPSSSWWKRVRYAPAAVATAEQATALELATAIVDALERQRRLDRHLAAAVAVVLASAALLAPAGADEVRPQTAFFQGNQAYAEGRYGDAVHAYESVRAAGQDSGALEFNLGQRVLQEQPAAAPPSPATSGRASCCRAIPTCRRTWRMRSSWPQVDDEAPPLWQRLAFPFAARATGSELAVVATVCWWAFWLLLAVRCSCRACASASAVPAAAAAALLSGRRRQLRPAPGRHRAPRQCNRRRAGRHGRALRAVRHRHRALRRAPAPTSTSPSSVTTGSKSAAPTACAAGCRAITVEPLD